MNKNTCIYSIETKTQDEIDCISKQTIKAINSKNIVVIPTETVYGLASIITKKSLDIIYSIKNRDFSKPIPIIIGKIEDLEMLTTGIDSDTIDIINKFWPGQLTIIFKKNKNSELSKIIGNKETVGVRMPNHKFLRSILTKTGPLICTSANISGEKSPISISEIPLDIKSNVNLIIDNGRIENGISSTIIDITKKQPILLRVGKIKKEDIEKIVNKKIKIA